MPVLGLWATGVVGFVAIIGLTFREPLLRSHSGERLFATAVWVPAGGVLVWRLTADGTGLPSAIATLGLLSLLIIFVTWGRPALVMDQLFDGEGEDGASMTSELRRRSRFGQFSFIGAVIVLAAYQTWG